MTKQTMYSIVAVVAAIVIIGGIYGLMSVPNTSNNITPTPTTDEKESSEDTTTTPSGTTTSLTYSAALNLYKDKRIQLNVDGNNYCAVTPNNVVFKKGTAVMFDNRSSKSVTFSLDKQAYTIKAYGFRIVTLTTSSALPHVMSLDCATGQNNGSITLQ